MQTGSTALDAVISQKKSYAASMGVPMRVQPSLAGAGGIHEGKLCAVVSNLLDNAIEASEGVPEPAIALSIRPAGRYLHIMTRNRVAQDIEKVNPELQTTKGRDAHGIGLSVVKSVVREYDGMMEHHMEGDSFVMSLMLLTPEGDDKVGEKASAKAVPGENASSSGGHIPGGKMS